MCNRVKAPNCAPRFGATNCVIKVQSWTKVHLYIVGCAWIRWTGQLRFGNDWGGRITVPLYFVVDHFCVSGTWGQVWKAEIWSWKGEGQFLGGVQRKLCAFSAPSHNQFVLRAGMKRIPKNLNSHWSKHFWNEAFHEYAMILISAFVKMAMESLLFYIIF